ncbi:hypothetical protein OYT1_ch1708 [Ferriphaselus amnicola]|uniref:Uncharacterized protein n=1 Tax=Ferriphaselus amnicola TaxID=1188319 RepID=A0A2Z6GCK4_9PROT|nr:hypothetical protein [Ferriphaselus amnicola]BBE51246.1 hypothetical protein OYT1_ch1708 [Ferriphaselus amnicola]
MKRIHPEFAYQSRELGIQIEDTLGEPPDRKNYQRVINSLLSEFANGSEIDDVNLLSFALVDHLQFDDAAGLLQGGQQYDEGDAAKIAKMVSCADKTAADALAAVITSNPELARKAIITAFLFKNGKRWSDEDHSLDALKAEEDKNEANDEDEDQMAAGENIEHLFDARGDENA